MKNMIKALTILVIALLCASCSHEQNQPEISAGDEEASSASAAGLPESVIAETSLLEALHNFNWMGHDGNGENPFADKPFLQMNEDGSNARAGVIDINRDGEKEFILAVLHPPRGIPSVEVFAFDGSRLQSIGGYFEGREMPHKLTYYKDEDGRILFLQEVEAYYGGTTQTLVATYLEDLLHVPVVSARSHYGMEGTEIYYVFPREQSFGCTNHFLCGDFGDDEELTSLNTSSSPYSVTYEEYDRAYHEFMHSLTWIEDVEYEYAASYQLYNYPELAGQLRSNEIKTAYEDYGVSGLEQYQTPEEYKKTNDMVADALYGAYCS